MTSQEDTPAEPVAGDAVGIDAVGSEPDAVASEPVEPREETVDGVPVLADVRPIEPASRSALPAVQAAAAAATGFVAGAATIALVRRRHTRRLALTRRRMPPRPVDMLPVVASRTFLVDVHVIAKPGE